MKRKLSKNILRKRDCVIKFKVEISVWWLLIILLIPAVAYADLVLFGKQTFFKYLIVNYIELLFIFIGYIIGINKK